MGSASIPYAFSVHSFINSVGADVGFASIVGLAILVLLYFAQARETSTLREQAGEAQQRVQQLEARLAHLARAVSSVAVSGPAPAPAPPAAMPIRTPGGRPLSPAIAGRAPGLAVTAAPPPPGSRGLTAIPAAPAMVAAPALAAATRLITIREPTPERAEPVAAPLEPALAGARGIPAAALAERPLAAVGGPGPATAAGNGSRTALPEFAPDGPERPDDTFYGALPADPPPPRAQTRQRPTPPPRRPGGPASRGPSGGGGRRGRRTIIALVGALLVVAIAVVAVLVISSGGSKPAPTTTSGTQAKTKPGSRAVAFNPASVRVSVLNGTSSSGLAANVGKRLTTDGYKLVSTGNASDQTHTVSTVFYDPGARNSALQVAKSLKLRSDMVEPIDAGTQSLACSLTTSACNVKVVVTVGTDLDTTS